MTWSLPDKFLGPVFNRWAETKNAAARYQLLLGLFELADRPWDDLPGFPLPGRSPMWRWVKIEQTLVVFLVAEPQGKLIVIDIRDG